MLQKPDLPEDQIAAILHAHFGVTASHLIFLPIGADQKTAVYRAQDPAGKAYFVKLRSGGFDELSVTVPRFLSDQAIPQIIAPLPTQGGRLWANLAEFKVILFPFVAGRNAYQTALTAAHWHEFGTALRRIHSADFPPSLLAQMRRETYSPRWRDQVAAFLAFAESEKARTLTDPIAVELADFLRKKRGDLIDLIQREQAIVQTLQANPAAPIVCHGDLHAGNLLLDDQDGLFIVDWDTLILAPKERDLMFVGGGLMGGWHTPAEEIAWFYAGYGAVEVDDIALAYYRYERIIEDIAIYCQQIFTAEGGLADRHEGLGYLKSNFLPGHTIAIARAADRTS